MKTKNKKVTAKKPTVKKVVKKTATKKPTIKKVTAKKPTVKKVVKKTATKKPIDGIITKPFKSLKSKIAKKITKGKKDIIKSSVKQIDSVKSKIKKTVSKEFKNLKIDVSIKKKTKTKKSTGLKGMPKMQILQTISGRQIKISSNKSKRTFTIVTESAKYRTYPMSKEEFKDSEYRTGNDWVNFLKSDDYYKVKN